MSDPTPQTTEGPHLCDTLEAAFLRVFAWVKDGVVEESSHDGPYRWRREGIAATDIRQSPAGHFMGLTGFNVLAYFRPDKPPRIGHMQRIDLRSGTSPADLVAMARNLLQNAPDIPPTSRRRIAVGRSVLAMLDDIAAKKTEWREDMWHELVGQEVIRIVEAESGKR